MARGGLVWKQRLWYHIGDHRDRRVHRVLAAASRSYLRAHEGTGNFQLDESGERRVLAIVGRQGGGTLIDVGANVGEWSLAAAELVPGSMIHAFEPVASTGVLLAKALAPLGDRAVVHLCGLSDEDTTMSINVPRDGSALSSLVAEGGHREQITLVRGDAKCHVLGIDHVRFLKIDTEGWDHRALAGMSGLLDDRAIDIVQFEYGPWALQSRFLLLDFYEHLEGAGMTIGKIYPRSVEFGPYRPELEDFRGLNFLAVARRHERLIAELSTPSE